MNFNEKRLSALEKAISDAVEVRSREPSPSWSIKYTKTKSVRTNPELLRERRVITGLKNDAQADIFRILRTAVLRKLRAGNWNALAITSPTPGAGKSLVTVNLAIALAMEVNQTVLVVDADLRNPNVGWFFGLHVEKGLLDYLREDIPLQEILINPGFERLVVLPGNGSSGHSSELLSSPKMFDLVRELKSKYESRIILFDLPPLLAADDTLLFMPNFEAALLVVEDGRNTPDEIRRSLRILEDTELAGVVLNKVKGSTGRSYYAPYQFP